MGESYETLISSQFSFIWMNLQQDDDIQTWTNKLRETHQVVYPNLVFSASLDLIELELSGSCRSEGF